MSNPFRIIDHIAEFTSLRDLELLEFSLLKSVYRMMQPYSIRFLKVDGQGIPLKSTEFDERRHRVLYEDIWVGEEVQDVLQLMQDADIQEYVLRKDEFFINCFNVLHDGHSDTLLFITTKKPLSKQESYMVSGILQIYSNFNHLLCDSQTDQLTGLANRKTFEDAIKNIFKIKYIDDDDFPDDHRAKSEKTEAVYWIAMVDIDHFKRINDTLGHLYGDEVLVLLAQLLKASFRKQDLIFRFGGEEFVIILRSEDRASCEGILERFRSSVESTDFPGIHTLTVSAGAARMEPDTFHLTLIDYADQAFYYSKNNGRNQVTFFDDLVAMNKAKVEPVESGEIDLF